MDIRAQLLAQKDRQPAQLYTIRLAGGETTDVVFIMPPEKLMNRHGRTRKRVFPDGSTLIEPELPEEEYETLVLLHCVREPVLGELVVPREGEGEGGGTIIGPVRGADGYPLYGKPVFTKADAEVLNGDGHQVGGWRRRLLEAFARFMQEASGDIVEDLKLFLREDEDGVAPGTDEDPEGNDAGGS